MSGKRNVWVCRGYELANALYIVCEYVPKMKKLSFIKAFLNLYEGLT